MEVTLVVTEVVQVGLPKLAYLLHCRGALALEVLVEALDLVLPGEQLGAVAVDRGVSGALGPLPVEHLVFIPFTNIF